MGVRGLPTNVSHELMFQTLARFDKAIQSYPSANAGYRNGALIVHFSFGEQEERLRVSVCLRFSRVERILCEFSRIFHLIKVCEV